MPTLREQLWAKMPDNVYDLKVDRGEVHGLPSIHCIVYYRDQADKSWFLDMNFTNKNQMNAEHIAAVLRSYMNYDSGRESHWESEGGNGSNR